MTQQNTTARDARVAARSEGFVQARLTGPVVCRAYGIGNAVRLGNVTLVVGDRQAAASIARAAILVEDLAPRLGYTYPGRRFPYRGRENTMTTLIELHGEQELSDLDLRSAGDRCGQASFTMGSVRITLCDRDAAETVAKALADAYNEARHTFARLLSFDEVRAASNHRRSANKARRRGVRL